MGRVIAARSQWYRRRTFGEDTHTIGIDEGRIRSLTAGYFWFPVPDAGSVNWELLTCHDLGRGAEVDRIDLWPAVIDRLAEVWRRDAKVVRRRLRGSYSGLPRGRVTRPGRRSLILHGEEAPVSDWVPVITRRFHLDRHTVRVVFDEHERMLPEDRRILNALLGIGSDEVRRDQRGAH
jgi:hypothetical protein